MEFDLWLETEHVQQEMDDFCNVLVTLSDGRKYALNVWTYSFFAVARQQGEQLASAEFAHTYMLPPDLFVADLKRTTLESVVTDMLKRGLMPERSEVIEEEDPPDSA